MQPSYFPPPLRSSSLRTFSVVGVVASVLLLALSSVAADELPEPIPDDIGGVTSPAPPTEGPKIHIPVMPVLTEPEIIDELPAPPPRPSRGPVPVASLQEDTWYIIESAVPLIVLHSPSGFVECEENRGPRPMAVRGKFADGTGRTETRTFQSEYLYFVNAVKGGQIELMVIPVGVESEVDVIRQTLTVMGTAPQPPPKPDDPPVPTPNPVPVPPTGIRVLMLWNETGSRDQLNSVNSSEVTAWMNANCVKGPDGRPEWRRWDRTSVSKPGMLDRETEVWKKLWADIQPSITQDNMIIVVTDTKATVAPMVGPAETLAMLNRIKEGKAP